MPAAWMPGLVHDAGDFAQYDKGHNRMEMVKVHATAKNGAGNITVGKQGYFQFYCPKVGPGMQFQEADALCYDSGNFNDEGPGIEFEREGTGVFPRDGLQEFEPLTPDQVASGQAIFAWLHAEWGVPLALYDGPRYQAAPNWRGFVNHGDLDQNRSDGITLEEWATLTASPATPQPKDDDMKVLKNVDTGQQYLIDGGMFPIDDETAGTYRNVLGVNYHEGNQRECDVIGGAYPAPTSGSGGGPLTVISTVTSEVV